MRTAVSSLTLAVLLIAAGDATAAAQRCEGSLDFDRSGVHLAGSAATAQLAGESLGNYALTLSAGRKRGAYIDVGGSMERQPGGRDGRALRVTAATSVRPEALHGIELCPFIGISRQRWDATNAFFYPPGGAPLDSMRMDQDVDRIALGTAAGSRMRVSAKTSVVPFVSATYVVRRSVMRYSGSYGSGIPDRSHTDALGLRRMGVGLALGDRVTIQPHVDVPLGVSRQQWDVPYPYYLPPGGPADSMRILGPRNANTMLFDSRTSYGMLVVVGLGGGDGNR